ncbi:M1 family metallopeptidase [Paraflavisolibacter sp. H34]|uniref:M1 family metallopeptidase n=1 Tax=Huijunlia imazamoxiresistens TaxID=3127457 RepID=UPI0030166764
MKLQTALFFCLAAPLIGLSQGAAEKSFSRADTLRGSITAERSWWDVQQYDIRVCPDYTQKTIAGHNRITYKVLKNAGGQKMQVDLQEPLRIDSVLLDRQRLAFSKEGAAWHLSVPAQKAGSVNAVTVYYSGAPREAVRAPWDGGWTFAKDSLGRPWMTVTCQGLGASVWYPCKDHQSDEPDKGASLEMVVPDTLVAVANGRLESQKNNGDGTASYKWRVVNPINNYNLIPYIGRYEHFSETHKGEKGKLDLDYWVLDYNEAKAKDYLPKEVRNMLNAFEHWFGPYPFYEDGYKLVDVPHTGMEHQSAVAYGNWYKPGYRQRDGSGTGWGLKWDFIVIHESGHEWFGNNITSKDLADMWIHESFTNYSETLFVDYIFGRQAGNEYNWGTRKGIRNDKPIIPEYGVNRQGSGDMYPKGGNMLHAIRHSLDNDALFRNIMRGMNAAFYHQTVTAQQVEGYISRKGGYDYRKVFDQYLRTTQVPRLEYYFSADRSRVFYRYANCVEGFNLPLVLKNGAARRKIIPSEKWKSAALKPSEVSLFDSAAIEKMYYVQPVQVQPS